MLLTPGPTPVPEFVRVAMSGETIHHRTPEFEAIFAKTRELLIELFGMDEALMLVSSGTGAMEACVTNLTHKKALTVNSGKFGERFGKICDAYNIPKVELKYEWDTPCDIKDVEKALDEHSDIDAIFIQICESAGGLRHPVEEIAKLAKSKNIWERRIAVVSTYTFIKNRENHDIFELTKILLNDKHDLIHKACGWMLRESGKSVSEKDLELFLEENYHKMPRTMLRYAIEKFSDSKRQHFLKK